MMWRKHSERVVALNPWWTYKLDTYELPSGKHAEYHYLHTNGSAMVVPLLDDGRVVLVKQYRYLMSKESLEFPGGGTVEGASMEDTGRRELAEETGYAAAELVSIGAFNPYNGMTDEMCHVYLGRGLRYVGGQPDETEELEVVPLMPEQVEELMRNGVIWDGMTMAAWQLARDRLH